MALYTGSWVSRFHTMVVSRWLVMPMVMTSLMVSPAFTMASAATLTCVYQISLGSCSTQPGLGYSCVNSFCAMETTDPFLSNTIARELVVPWSNARTYCGIMKIQI